MISAPPAGHLAHREAASGHRETASGHSDMTSEQPRMDRRALQSGPQHKNARPPQSVTGRNGRLSTEAQQRDQPHLPSANTLASLQRTQHPPNEWTHRVTTLCKVQNTFQNNTLSPIPAQIAYLSTQQSKSQKSAAIALTRLAAEEVNNTWIKNRNPHRNRESHAGTTAAKIGWDFEFLFEHEGRLVHGKINLLPDGK
jgi:hypothetical protein